MALHTPLTPADAERVCHAYGLGGCAAVAPVVAGSVNSNYVLTTPAGPVFLRVYEEQEADGVAFEWEALAHLAAAGVPVAAPLAGPAPGAVRVAGKPAALFPFVVGVELCRRQVTAAHLAALGRALAAAHLAAPTFGRRRAGRFTLPRLVERLDRVDLAAHPALAADVALLRGTLAELLAEGADASLPEGLIHGDLFRDNVRWRDGRPVALLDWESACTGPLALDVLVVAHAWAYSDGFEWPLARAFLRGYESARPLGAAERASLRWLGRAAACRFAVTRITDFYLRPDAAQGGYRDYRRFLARLRDVTALSNAELEARLLGP